MPEGVPVLAPLLATEKGETLESVRRGLRKLVGKDLGSEPIPWLVWFKARAK